VEGTRTNGQRQADSNQAAPFVPDLPPLHCHAPQFSVAPGWPSASNPIMRNHDQYLLQACGLSSVFIEDDNNEIGDLVGKELVAAHWSQLSNVAPSLQAHKQWHQECCHLHALPFHTSLVGCGMLSCNP
jgi:hypothetical protein